MLNKNKIGMALGSFAGLWHLIWSALIYFGWAQPLLNFIFDLHSLSTPVIVGEFNLTRSISLIVVTSIVGYVVGFIFTSIYNKVHK